MEFKVMSIFSVIIGALALSGYITIGDMLAFFVIINMMRLIGYLLEKIRRMLESYETCNYIQRTFLFCVFCAILNSWLSI